MSKENKDRNNNNNKIEKWQKEKETNEKKFFVLKYMYIIPSLVPITSLENENVPIRLW